MPSPYAGWQPGKGSDPFKADREDEPLFAGVSPFASGFREQENDRRAYEAAPDNFLYNAVQAPVESTVSSIFELFGADPSPGVQKWRDNHPIADVVSQIAGMAVPYVGWAKVTQAPRLALALEGATEAGLKAFGSTALRSPVSAGALKEFLRFTPLEMSRLGTGYAVGADMGDMFADVGISQAIAGSLGGIGGFLRAGGKATSAIAKTGEAELGLLPAFEYRIAKMPDSQIIGNVDRDQYIFGKMQEALKDVPVTKTQGMKGQYVYDLEGAAPESSQFLESLFRANPSNLSQDAMRARPFDVRQLHTDGKAWSVGDGVGDAVAKKAGFTDLADLAENVVYPRLVTVQDTRFGAGVMGGQIKKLIDGGGLKKLTDGVLMGQEDGGLWVVMKRVEQGAEPAAVEGGRRPAFQFGPAQVRQGDQWLIGKTDKPEKFAPDLHKINAATQQSWAKMKDPFRQINTPNPIGQRFNTILTSLEPGDWDAARLRRKGSWITDKSAKLAARIKNEGGIADQAQIQQMAEHLYDWVAPTAVKLQGDPMFSRFATLLFGGMHYADDQLSKIMKGEIKSTGKLTNVFSGKDVEYLPHDGYKPVRENWARLTDDERQLVVMASHTQTPAADLAKLSADGVVSPRVKEVIEELQAVNRNVLDKHVIPALQEAGMHSEAKWLDGYILPRVFKGDAMVRVVDEAGNPQWIASGTPLQAEAQAKAVVEEALRDGKKWTTLPMESKAFKGAGEADNLDSIYSMVAEQLGQNKGAQETVQKAMRRLLAEKGSTPTPGKPPRLLKERTGIPGTPDGDYYSLDDVISASENHYRQLLRYSAFHSWKHRFGDAAATWGKNNEIGYTDLMRKAGQYMGVESQLTEGLNKALQPVFGNTLGGKAATRIAKGTNALMYNWNLGIMNPSFALLNLLQPLQTTAPWIAFMQNAPLDEAARMMQMDLRLNGRGQVAGTVGTLAPLKILGESWKLMKNPTDEFRQMFDQGVQDGTLNAAQRDEWIGNHSERAIGLKEAAGKGGWDFIKHAATVMATRSEQYSRTMSFASAYLLGKDVFNLSGDTLYRFAKKGTETTMYGYGVMDRSRVLTGPLGSSFGLFKNWQFHFLSQMAQYAGVGMRDGVWSPMLWQLAAATALGGLGATPLKIAADGLAKWQGEQPNSFYWLQDNWQGPVGDALYFGLPALLGVSLQASSTIPGTDVMQDIESLSNVVMWERAKAAWGAIGSAADLWEGTGKNPLSDPNIRDKLIAGFLPRAAVRGFSAVEGDYIKSMSTGQPTVRDLPPVTKLLHASGFNMTEIEKHYIVGKHLYAKQQARRDAIQDLGEAFAQAQLSRDAEAMTGIINRAVATGVPVSSVISSAKTRTRREQTGEHLSRFDKQDQARAQQILGN